MKRSAGFSLLEVVVALGVSSVGLSAVCAMLIATAAGTSSLSQQATARWLGARLKAEWSLAPDADPERLATHGDPMVCDHQLACSPTAFMARNYADWQRLVTRMLPGGSGHVCRDSTPGDGNPADPACDDTGNRVIKVYWQPAGRAGADALLLTTVLEA
ncbi:MAG: type IV pilus modification PilV family protein [Lysobacterales bacterium]